MEIFDEDKAVAFIKNKLSENEAVTARYSSDDILEVIDIIWDYYEDNGFLDLDMSVDADDDAGDVDKAALIAHVQKMIAKDKGTKISTADVPAIVEAELDYEQQCDEI